MCLRKICNLAFHVELDALWLLNNEVLPAFSCIVLTMVISLKKERKKKTMVIPVHTFLDLQDKPFSILFETLFIILFLSLLYIHNAF